MRAFNQSAFVVCLAATLLGAAAPAHALFGDDEARKAILDLRQRVDALQNAQLQLVGQLEQLREANAQLTYAGYPRQDGKTPWSFTPV